MSRSRAVFDVFLSNKTGKLWAWIRVRDKDRKRAVSFEDIFRILVAIVHCENEKYKGRVAQPSRKVRQFLNSCIDIADRFRGRTPTASEIDAAWLADLAPQYEMPARTRGQAE